MDAEDILPEPLAGLVRDHVRASDVVTDARSSVERAANRPDSADRFAVMLDELHDLEHFLTDDLTIHIAKEEEVLFPALRQLAQDTSRLVDDMVAQHDEIRERQALIEQTLAAVDAHHDTIGPERATFAATLSAAASQPGPAALATLREGVKRLDWILQGHFEDEEEHLFMPAATLLSPDTLADLAQRMAALQPAD